jgi:long-chain acyl-CoA synthetase
MEKVVEKAWSKNYVGGVRPHLDYSQEPLQKFLEKNVQKNNRSIGMVYEGVQYSWGYISKLSDAFSSALIDLGVKKGDRVVLALPNTPQLVVSFFATLKIGAIAVFLDPICREKELTERLKDSRAEVIIVSSDVVRDYDLYLGVEQIKEKTRIRHVITTSILDPLPPVDQWFPLTLPKAKNKKRRDTLDWFKLVTKHAGDEPVVSPLPNDVVALEYVGETGGVQKAVAISHRNLVANATQLIEWLKLKEEDIVLGTIPFFHSYGLMSVVTTTLLAGCKMVVVPRFEVSEVFKAIQKHKVTFFPGVQAMFMALVYSSQAGSYDLRTVRVSLALSTRLPEDVKHQFEAMTSGPLIACHGLTEATSLTHANPLDRRKTRSGSIGTPLPDTEATVFSVDDPDMPVGTGEEGLLGVKGPQVTKGYWNNQEETAKLFNKSGWLLTGDLVKMDADGYFYVVGQAKGYVDVAGFKVWPKEVEQTLLAHPAVQECSVIAVYDPFTNERVKALVKLKPGYGGRISAERLSEHCKTRLAPHKAPAAIEFVEELPLTI